jgi:hypothetical protein
MAAVAGEGGFVVHIASLIDFGHIPGRSRKEIRTICERAK